METALSLQVFEMLKADICGHVGHMLTREALKFEMNVFLLCSHRCSTARSTISYRMIYTAKNF